MDPDSRNFQIARIGRIAEEVDSQWEPDFDPARGPIRFRMLEKIGPPRRTPCSESYMAGQWGENRTAKSGR
jgi:hypothetical protein